MDSVCVIITELDNSISTRTARECHGVYYYYRPMITIHYRASWDWALATYIVWATFFSSSVQSSTPPWRNKNVREWLVELRDNRSYPCAISLYICTCITGLFKSSLYVHDNDRHEREAKWRRTIVSGFGTHWLDLLLLANFYYYLPLPAVAIWRRR